MHFYLSCKIKLMLYYTLIYPYITYCNSMWSSTYVSNLNGIYYLQKRAVWAITNWEYRAHTAPLFSKLEILDIFQVIMLDTAKFMFRYHNNLLPSLFRNLFMTNSQVHRYKYLPSPYGVFPGPLGQCISVTYPRWMAGRCLDNLGVREHEHFCIFEKFTRSTEVIYK